jgi:hypothetical protein
VPKLAAPENLFDEEGFVSLQQIKLGNCYLYEVLKDSNVQLVHLDKGNYVRSCKRFALKEKKTEYVVDTRMMLRKGGKGEFLLLSLDHCFADNEPVRLENTTILKVAIEKHKDFEEARVEFSNKFLAYAKKHSVVNICKKFNQMVHDSLCLLNVKAQLSGQAEQGQLRVLNAKCEGPFGDIRARITVDGVSLHCDGLIGSFLLEKPSCLDVPEGMVTVEGKVSNVAEQTSNT